MLDVPGFSDLRLLHEGHDASVLEATRLDDGIPVVLKIAKARHPGVALISRFEREHRLTSSLDVEGVVRCLEFRMVESRPLLVFESDGGRSLNHLMRERRLTLAESLRLAGDVARALSGIHHQGVVHWDIKPANLIVDSQLTAARLTDFGIATRGTRDGQGLGADGVLQGTLAYMSPEQTGRMNRGVDHRTDFYSLGVTLYEMLTGELPFRSDDALSYIHAHIARRPRPPRDVSPSVPAVVSDLVMKLISKNAEDRYQSASALVDDLARCLDQLDENGHIPAFPLAARDISDRFTISQQLYGREAERELLLDGFSAARAGGRELIVVSGPAGVGKSALVNEIDRPVVEAEAHFVAGKFPQFGASTPYSALIEAFEGLVSQLLARPEAELEMWRVALLKAMGTSGAIITEVLPAIEAITGPQPPVSQLAGPEAQNRFRQVFQNIVRVFCLEGRPLVLFLDDVQWADHATVSLLEGLLRDDATHHLVIVAASRDNEVGAADPFPRAIYRLEEAGMAIRRIALGPLSPESVHLLIADTLSCSKERCALLAELVHARTLGNPFFVNQFLGRLHDRGAIGFDDAARAWTWHVDGIRELGITDNVVELMSARLLELDPACQHVLQLAACIGSRFELGMLAEISGKTPPECLAALQPALVDGLIVPARAADSSTGVLAVHTHTATEDRRFRFRHDRVHQAAWGLTDAAERTSTHLTIGRRLLDTLDEQEARIFDVVGQLNQALDLIEEPEEQARLAMLNSLAARRAMASFAFGSTLGHVGTALDLAGSSVWADDYAMALQLHIDGAAAAAASGEPERMRELCDTVFAQGKDVYDKLPAYETLINHYFSASEQVTEALEVGYDAIAELGLKLPRKATALHVAYHLIGVKLAMRGKTPEALAELPEMTDRRVLTILRLLVSLDGVAYMANPNAFALHILVGVKLSLKYGNGSPSGWAWNLYGAILCAALGDIHGGKQVSDFGFALAERLEDRWMMSRIATPRFVTVTHWTTPMQEIPASLSEWTDKSLELGAYPPAGANLMYLVFYRLFAGALLGPMLEEQRAAQEQCRGLGEQLSVDFIGLVRALTRALTSEGVEPLIGETELASFEAADNRNGVFAVHFMRAMRCYLMGEYDEALGHSELATKEEASAAGTVLAIQQTFYRSLMLLAVEDVPGKARKEVRSRLKKIRGWQGFCAHNMKHKADLVEAELARVEGRHSDAAALYESARSGARDTGFLHELAIAVERAGRWQFGLGADSLGALLMADARYEYRAWGATQKVVALDAEFPRTQMALDSTMTGMTSMRTTGSTDRSLHSGLDMSTILRTAQTLSGEIVLDRLLTAVMEGATENAGAQSGVLLLNEDGELLVQAARRASGEVDVLQSRAVDDRVGVCPGIVHWVRRTRKNLVLDDASADPTFARDPYVKANNVRSVLCVPLVNQNELVAILYLENNLATAAFTPERIELMMLLSAQAAISIRNARLYTQQVELTESYSRFVPREFLSHLGRESVVGVELGDSVETDMAVLFSDIRGFTTLSEGMSPQENFTFLNEFLGRMGPAIRLHNGLVDKYIGDAIMALFPGGVGDACRAAVAMNEELLSFNADREERGRAPVRIGIGLHVGRLMLGIIGEPQRMEGTVISDAVNVAARLESLTKTWSTSVLLSEEARGALPVDGQWSVRSLGRVKLKGKREETGLYELLDADGDERRAAKEANGKAFAIALDDMRARRYAEAERALAELTARNPEDGPAQLLLNRCRAARVREAGLFEALD